MNKKQKLIVFLSALGVLIYIAYGLCVSYVRATTIRKSNSVEQQALETHTRLTTHGSIPELIDYIAPQFGQPTKAIKTIVCSESNFLVLPHDGGRAVNVTGIWDTTFDGWLPQYEKEMGETLNKKSTFDQIKMMSWAFSKGDSYRYQWSTYYAYVNGGQARIWSRYYNRHFNIVIPNHCK
jgi:hypothetical protein